MKSLLRPVVTLLLATTAWPILASAQRRDAGTRGTPNSAQKNITVVPIRVRADLIANSGGASRPRSGNALSRGLRTALTGDKNKVAAARALAIAEAQNAAPPRSTLVVVIGGEDELLKVTESLAAVRRPITLAFADVDYADDTFDNSSLKSGVAGSVTDLADNLLVYLPRNGASPRSKPDHTLSTKVANAALWNGMFAMDGDELDLDLIASAVPKGEEAPAAAPTAAASTGAGTSTGGLNSGDVVAPKINGVKVYATASSDGKVVGTVGKTDELVVDGAEKDGFVKVDGTVTGWIKVSLLSKR